MIDKKDLAFIGQYFGDTTIIAIVSQAITDDAPELFIISKEHGGPFKLTTEHLNDIRRAYPHKPNVYTTKPQFNHRPTSLGRWQAVCIQDLLINKNDISLLKQQETVKVDVPALETKMATANAWYKNDFTIILNTNNPHLTEQDFRDLIYLEIKLKNLVPVSSTFTADSNPKERNYLLPSNSLLEFAERNKLNVGNLNKDNNISNALLSEIESKNATRPSFKERQRRYQEESDKIQHGNPTATKSAIVDKIIADLLHSDPSFITKDDGSTYPASTINRLITLRRTSTV
jgi:hypothetical protein